MSEEPKLLPCPFCGSQAKLYINGGANCCCGRCTECDAIGKVIYFDIDSEEYASGDSSKEEQRAIDAWNTRA